MSQVDKERIKRIRERLGTKVICEQCGASLDNVVAQCNAPLDTECPGFTAIEEAGKP